MLTTTYLLLNVLLREIAEVFFLSKRINILPIVLTILVIGKNFSTFMKLNSNVLHNLIIKFLKKIMLKVLRVQFQKSRKAVFKSTSY